MELKKTTKITHYVDAFDLAEFISGKIGRSVEIIDAANDTDYNAHVKKETIDDWDTRYVINLIDRGWISMELGYRTVLNYCANQGWIEEGDYAIRVSW